MVIKDMNLKVVLGSMHNYLNDFGTPCIIVYLSPLSLSLSLYLSKHVLAFNGILIISKDGSSRKNLCNYHGLSAKIETALSQIEKALLQIEIVSEDESEFAAGWSRFAAGR